MLINKKHLTTLTLGLFSAAAIVSCSSDEDGSGSNNAGNNENSHIISGNIASNKVDLQIQHIG